MKTLLAFTIGIFIVQVSFAEFDEVPSDSFKVRPTIYAFANYPNVFVDISEGLTIEVWVYVNETPPDRQNDSDKTGRWIIFAKPGSYQVSISGRNLADSTERKIESDFIFCDYEINIAGAGSRGGGGSSFPDEYLKKWIHVALQIIDTDSGTDVLLFYNQTASSDLNRTSKMKYVDSPFVLGGPNFIYGKLNHFESMNGFIREARVSKGIRYEYDNRGNIIADKSFEVDDRTIALWKFEEGHTASSYRDSSGNGYKLSIGGLLGVQDSGRIATTWGRLKQE